MINSLINMWVRSVRSPDLAVGRPELVDELRID
jgi:hypothetical protein